MLQLILFPFPDSVQKSLERKFAKDGEKIPITPSEEFERKIAVSVSTMDCIFLVLLMSSQDDARDM